ncbi:hypothetical protein JY454_13980, partial [Stenotrophomonas maltophilia]|nr:hypothetical protein [Stenotrophomonas maltophilia]
SMRLTPPRSLPARPLTVSVAATAGRKGKDQKQRQQQQPRAVGWGRIRFPKENGSDPSLNFDI